MYEVFEQHIENTIPGLSKEQMSLLLAKCIMKKLRRKQMILHEGEVAQYKIFVMKGLLRNYSIAENGYEHIMRFTDAGNWTTDPESYYTGIASKYNIDALEPSEIIMFKREDFDALKKTIPAVAIFSELIISKNASLTQKRVLMNISASAEEKYIDFIDTYANIFSRVPLHMVASYLGVSRETLTRIRHGMSVAEK